MLAALSTSMLALVAGLVPIQDERTNEQKLAVYRKIRESTFMIRASFGDGKAKIGTGVVIRESNNAGFYAVIITNAHVVKSGDAVSQDISVRAWDRSKEVWRAAKVLSLMEDADKRR